MATGRETSANDASTTPDPVATEPDDRVDNSPSLPQGPAEVRERLTRRGSMYSEHGVIRHDTTDSGWEPLQRRSGIGMPKVEPFGDEPPTEESPEAMYEVRGAMPASGMTVPEPPPIPGLFEEPRSPTGRATEPAALPSRASMISARDEITEEAPPPRSTPTWALFIGALGAGAVLMLAFLLVLSTLSTTHAPVASPDLPRHRPAAEPVVEPVPDARPVVGADLRVDPSSVEPAPTTDATGTKVSPADNVQPTVKAAGKPTGSVTIRSNRRALVKVNGVPKDYSPVDLNAAPGTYIISAALPGRPESEQVVSIDLAAGESEQVNFSF